jgi:beta-glucosidase
MDVSMGNPVAALSRREFLTVAGAGALAATAGSAAGATQSNAHGFPKDFLWGASTAGHQIEGNNVNSDVWLIENLKPSFFAEPSGDACDGYHRFAEDTRLLATLGFNAYRFSLEWSRIEPEQGMFSMAELDHYRRVLEACHANGLTPIVTFNHYTCPRWFAALGGWDDPGSPGLFARFCTRAATHLGDLMGAALTLNEPNVGRLMHWLLPALFGDDSAGGNSPLTAMQHKAAVAAGSDRFVSMFTGGGGQTAPNMLQAHAHGVEAIKSARPGLPVGVSLAMTDEQAVGADSQRDAMRADVYDAWLEAAAKGDFIGVQTYTRNRFDVHGVMAKPPGAELTQTGDEFYPEALEATIRYAHAATRKPVYVTENGIATEDDTRRVEYIRRALLGVRNCLRDGLPVRSYLHWSLLDNFEWVSGYKPKFGLVAVDRQTFRRTPKPSARYLGAVARANGASLKSPRS